LNFEHSKKRIEDKKQLDAAIIEMKKQQANTMKKEQKKNLKVKHKFLKSISSENQIRSKIIKEQEHYAKERREKIDEFKKNFVKQIYETRVFKEQRKVKKKEKELMQMEMLEMELIKNLQNTHSIQK